MLDNTRQIDTAEAYDSMVRGIAPPGERAPQVRGKVRLPSGTVVVSADNHWSVTDDIFHDRFPAHLKDRAPRLFTDDDGANHWYVDGKSIIPPVIQRVFGRVEAVSGCVSIEPRLRDLDTEGIEKEIVFGNAIGIFYAYPDLEVREWVFRIDDQHLSEMQARAPGRFYGVGLLN
jgi:hypothetical protein